MRSWPAGGVGEGTTTRATLALAVADKLRGLLSEGAASAPLGHHSSRAPRPGPALCPDPWGRGRSRQVTALGEHTGLVRTWGLGGPQNEEIPPGLWRWSPPPRLPSLVDSVSLLVSENKEVTVHRLAVWTLSLVLGGPRWPGPGPRDGIWVTSPRVCVGWAAGIPGLGVAPRTGRLRDGAQGVQSACSTHGPSTCTLAGSEGLRTGGQPHVEGMLSPAPFFPQGPCPPQTLLVDLEPDLYGAKGLDRVTSVPGVCV